LDWSKCWIWIESKCVLPWVWFYLYHRFI